MNKTELVQQLSSLMLVTQQESLRFVEAMQTVIAAELQQNGSIYIQLTGNATQGGITYSGVSFKLYVGNDVVNDYNVLRNNNYTITVTLTGVDFADKRITIGSMPTMTNLAELAAAEGATTEFNVIAQPSAPWSFTVPATATFTVAVGTPPVNTNITVTQKVGGPPPPAVEGKKLYIADTNDGSYEQRRESNPNIPAASSFTKKNYLIEVSSNELGTINYSAAQQQCVKEGNGWRLPNMYELHVMYQNRAALGQPAFLDHFYWSSSPYGSTGNVCLLFFYFGNFGSATPGGSYFVRCVRDIP